MKSEQEFLSSMWSEIGEREWEAKQKLITHELNKRLFIKEILAYGIITLFVLGCLFIFLINDNPDIVYIIAVLVFAAAFSAERLYFTKFREASINENRNYY